MERSLEDESITAWLWMSSFQKREVKNGERFGFVRLANYTDTRRVTLRLNGFRLFGYKIQVNFAHFNGISSYWRKSNTKKAPEVSKDSSDTSGTLGGDKQQLSHGGGGL